MNIRQNELFAEYGLPVSERLCLYSAGSGQAADKIGGNTWVVKCQVHAGGRGKAGGVKLAKEQDEIRAFAPNWLGKTW